MMVALGIFRFSVETAAPQEEVHHRGWSWVENEVVGEYPSLQFTGPEPETLQFKGLIYPHYKGGLAQMDLIAAMAGTGTPLLMVTGLGRVLGLWVIESIDENKTVFFDNGAPRRIEFGVQLKKYGNLNYSDLGNVTLGNLGVDGLRNALPF